MARVTLDRTFVESEAFVRLAEISFRGRTGPDLRPGHPPVSRRSTSHRPAGGSLRLTGQQLRDRGADERGVAVRRVAHRRVDGISGGLVEAEGDDERLSENSGVPTFAGADCAYYVSAATAASPNWRASRRLRRSGVTQVRRCPTRPASNELSTLRRFVLPLNSTPL
jgi:hypothetical protein